MHERLNEVLPLVTKPIRYTGGEYNSFYFEPGSKRVNWVLAMPDVYEIGMSNYGLRILYSIINRLPNGCCERCYAPWPDFGAILKARGIPLYALESRRPVKEFNILGVSLQSELTYTNLLYLLDLAGIPRYRTERGCNDPLVVAGGPGTVNPLPMADFVDVFVVGDGEEAVREITAVYEGWNQRSREGLLENLARLPGLYVPGFTDTGKARVIRRVVSELREEDFPFPPLVPICEITHDRLTVEIARGCTRGCRFCQAGIINRPVRFRDVEQVVRIAERGIRSSGWEEVSLLALSALDYPYLLELVERLNKRLRERRVAISLPSTRGEDFTPELAFSLQEIKKAGLTFAPETAAPRLRNLLNKHIAEEKILESVRNALDAGWAGVKLYFMIGLPGETEADVKEIGRFVTEVARLCRGRTVRFNLTPFIPKPHTPLQWAGFGSIEETREKMALLKEMLNRRNIKPKWENPEASFVQALIARGDEKIGRVIERVYEQGGIFQEWTEFFNFSAWLDACSKSGVDPATYLSSRAVEDTLPWDFIDVGVTKGFLIEEYRRAQQGERTPDCMQGGCTNCGACPGPKPVVPPAPVEIKDEVPERFGRKPRRVQAYEELKSRFRLKYLVEEPFQFAAHLDRVRAFYRTLRRSELPVVYTKGFAPKPMLSFGPPLPVGLTSDGEYVDIYLSYQYSGNIVRDIGQFLPRGIRVVAARLVPNSMPTLGGTINLGRYEVVVPDEEALQQALVKGKEIPGVHAVVPLDREKLLVDLTIGPGVKLFDVLGQLLGREGNEVRCLTVKRKDCFVLIEGELRSPFGDVVR
ncbi:TIGR03960 family B12-binding radical SAM protein [candidate division WOR-3 bacterium]|nr:TIGR03960 family B12-binding radical SAM protein [candidate division WOR-3 bacterium]